jgi:hypothetical protein
MITRGKSPLTETLIGEDAKSCETSDHQINLNKVYHFNHYTNNIKVSRKNLFP